MAFVCAGLFMDTYHVFYGHILDIGITSQLSNAGYMPSKYLMLSSTTLSQNYKTSRSTSTIPDRVPVESQINKGRSDFLVSILIFVVSCVKNAKDNTELVCYYYTGFSVEQALSSGVGTLNTEPERCTIGRVYRVDYSIALVASSKIHQHQTKEADGTVI